MREDRTGQMWYYEGGPAPQVRTKLLLVLRPGQTRGVWHCLCSRGNEMWKMDLNFSVWEGNPHMTRIV